MLKDLYIVITDQAGNSALEICVPVDSEEFRILASERHPLQRLVGEARLGMEVEDEVEGHRKLKLIERYEKGN